jgi:hypothetical protein
MLQELNQTFTEEQKKDNLRLAIKALRDNPKKAMDTMQDNAGGRCCLCVMAHVAEDIMGYDRGELCGIMTPRFDMSAVFGTRAIQPTGNFVGDPTNVVIGEVVASRYNDGDTYIGGLKPLAHVEIADMLEKEYLTD